MPLPLQQHWAYGLAISSYGATVYQKTLFENETPVGHALISSRKMFRFADLSVCMRGPLWYQPTNSDDPRWVDGFKALKAGHSKLRWDFFALQPDLPNIPLSRQMMKAAKTRRVMTGFSTVWLDIRPDAETLRAGLHGKWRNQLKKAEASDSTISLGGKREHQYLWLLEKEAMQRSNRRYQATPLGMTPKYISAYKQFRPKDAPPVLTVTAHKGKERIAAALFLLHGNSATYYIGWAGDEARALNIHNRVLWEAITALKERGIGFLDLGGLNTADLAGIARFKLGMGAEPVTFVGTYV
ncbi:GNAT family N-acetyltransferase [Kordiimonas sediminis]|nr:GNAT family N-acetyltransferase [Kordiimonas sediminis]